MANQSGEHNCNTYDQKSTSFKIVKKISIKKYEKCWQPKIKGQTLTWYFKKKKDYQIINNM